MSTLKKVLIVIAALIIGLFALGQSSTNSKTSITQAKVEIQQTTAPDQVAPEQKTYTNVDDNKIPSPVQAPSAPAGATAQCRDGSYSFSQHRSGTCSHHGGVAQWL